MIKNIKNFFPLKQLFVKQTNKTDATNQNLLPSDVKMKQPLQEDVFEKTQKSEDIKGDELVEQKSAENQVDENSNQTSKKNAEETSIDKPNDNSYNVESEDVKVGESEKVEEAKRNRPSVEEVWKKVLDVCLEDIDEPEYVDEKFEPLEDAPSTFVRSFYDKNGTLRKKIIESYHNSFEQLYIHAEDGKLINSFVVTVSKSSPHVLFTNYKYNDNGNLTKTSKKVSAIDLSVSEYDEN